jgi:serine protease Do
MSLLEETSAALQEAATGLGPAVVGLGRGWGVGSGVVIAPGRVLTNAHNLRHQEVTVTFADGRRASARVVGSDADLDVAVLEVDTGEVQPLQFSDEDETSIGQPVLALGNPGGRGLRVTPGFVSSVARSFRGPRGRRVGGAIEHTAPLPRGSSGGALVDLDGHMIGINAVRQDGGLILAIAADRGLRERVDALGRGEAPTRVRLGVAIAPPRVARRLRRAVGLPELNGVLVRAVEEDSAAERAGIERGDLIIGAAGNQIDRVDALYEALDGVHAGEQLELTVLRGADERTVVVTF